MEKLGAAIPESIPGGDDDDLPPLDDLEVDDTGGDDERMVPESEAPPPAPTGSEPDDWEGAGKHKEVAAEAKANGDFAGAVDAFSSALACQASALTFAVSIR